LRQLRDQLKDVELRKAAGSPPVLGIASALTHSLLVLCLGVAAVSLIDVPEALELGGRAAVVLSFACALLVWALLDMFCLTGCDKPHGFGPFCTADPDDAKARLLSVLASASAASAAGIATVAIGWPSLQVDCLFLLLLFLPPAAVAADALRAQLPAAAEPADDEPEEVDPELGDFVQRSADFYRDAAEVAARFAELKERQRELVQKREEMYEQKAVLDLQGLRLDGKRTQRSGSQAAAGSSSADGEEDYWQLSVGPEDEIDPELADFVHRSADFYRDAADVAARFVELKEREPDALAQKRAELYKQKAVLDEEGRRLKMKGAQRAAAAVGAELSAVEEEAAEEAAADEAAALRVSSASIEIERELAEFAQRSGDFYNEAADVAQWFVELKEKEDALVQERDELIEKKAVLDEQAERLKTRSGITLPEVVLRSSESVLRL